MSKRPESAPPALARFILRWALDVGDPADEEGALAELYERRLASSGERSARAWYWRQVIGFVWRRRRLARAARWETEHEEAGMRWYEGVGTDVRQAMRALKKRPTFSAVVVLTLALGIGANSAVFALVSAHFLTPLPYHEPGRLVLLWETGRNTTEVTTVSPGNYLAWRQDARSLEDIAAFNVSRATLSGDALAEGVTASVVTPNFFDVLGVRPALGEGFTDQLLAAHDGDVVILGHDVWTRRHGSDPSVVGSTIRVDGRPQLVAGVLPPSFRQPERSLSWQGAEVWRPIDLEGQENNHGSRYLRTVARVRPESSVGEVREEMGVIADRLERAFPESNEGRSVMVYTLDDYLLADARPTLLVLLAAGGAVLLIVCANVANLTLARGQGRRQEFAVRAALGSGRVRLWRQVIVEGLVLAALGSALGLLAVRLGRGPLQAAQQRFFSGLIDVSVDARVVAFTAAVAAMAGVIFALPTARAASRPELRDALVEGGSRSGAGRGTSATRNLLVVGQVALATALVVSAALLSRSFANLIRTEPGFDASGVVAFSLSAPAARYQDRASLEQYYREVWRRVEQVPGVTGAGLVSDMPFTTENRHTDLLIDGFPTDPARRPTSEYRTAFPEYFRTMGIGLVSGRLPDDGWTASTEAGVVVNREMAEKFWPERDPVGATFRLDWSEPLDMRVVAVVENVLDDGFAAAPEPILYLPWSASPQRGLWVVARTDGDPATVLEPVRRAVAAVDPDVPPTLLRPLRGLMAETVARPRAASLIGGVFAVIALLVASAGIYGILSYSVQSRTREFGIRTALGASDSRIVGMVLRQSTRLVLLGLMLGLAVAVASGVALSGLLFGVPAWDPVSLLGATVVLASVGTLAAWVPARRAVRVDPRTALSAE